MILNKLQGIFFLGSKKDLTILYNLKRGKRKRRRASTSTMQSVHRMRSSKRRALVKSQYEELSQSQNLTQVRATFKNDYFASFDAFFFTGQFPHE